MEISAIKRFGGEDNPEGTDWPSGPAKLNDEHQNTETIPSLVSQIFLTKLRDVPLLKTCRLVCKTWNIDASESLKACSYVFIDESDESRLLNFKTLRLDKESGPLVHLPSPFRNYYVKGLYFQNPTFINLVLQPNVFITTLKLVLTWTCPDLAQLALVLAENNTTITTLIIIGYSDFDLVEETFLANEEVQLTSLKCLKLFDISDRGVHVPFMNIIVKRSKPETVDLFCKDGECVVTLLAKDRVGDLKHLKLQCFEKISTNAWNHLGDLKFRCIKSVQFDDPYIAIEPDCLEKWNLFCKNVSPNMEDFKTNIPISRNIRFPKLQTVEVWNNQYLSYFSPHMFPILSKVVYSYIVEEESVLSLLENIIYPHHGVRSMVINIRNDNFHNNAVNEGFDEDLLMVLTNVSRQFPKVSSLEFSIQYFRNITLPDICASFPQLKTLRLNGYCDFFAVSGMRNSMVAKYLEIGLPIENIPRRKSIIDLTELESISFGPKFVMDADVIKFCLPRVAKLRNLTFHWNKSLSAPLLRDSVSHLDKICISTDARNEYHATMAQVPDMLPNTSVTFTFVCTES